MRLKRFISLNNPFNHINLLVIYHKFKIFNSFNPASLATNNSPVSGKPPEAQISKLNTLPSISIPLLIGLDQKRNIDFFNSMNNMLQTNLIKSIYRKKFYDTNLDSYLPYLQMYIFDQLVENNKQDKEINNKLDTLIEQNEELNNKFDKLIELLSKE